MLRAKGALLALLVDTSGQWRIDFYYLSYTSYYHIIILLYYLILFWRFAV